ncbi:hypothetical protein vseg_013205 [Gypsophila vaccaria]
MELYYAIGHLDNGSQRVVRHYQITAAPAKSRRFSSFQIKASSIEETSTSELLDDLKEKWDKLENKSTILVYGCGAIVVVWLSSIIVGAINSVSLLPKIMELVGLGYSGWFVYRYLLFKSELQKSTKLLIRKLPF